MRSAGAIAILLILMVIFAGCGQRVPKSNTTTTPLWGGKRPVAFNGSSSGPDATETGTPVGPAGTTTQGPVAVATVIPLTTTTITPAGTYHNPPAPVNLTGNFTVIYDQTLLFTWNATAVTYNLANPPLLIDYTLTVPTVTRVRQGTDPVSGADISVTASYPDPNARFEVIVRDVDTLKIVARDGYGGQYDVSNSKQVRVLSPGNYHIQMSGNRLTARVKFTVPKDTNPS
jgi:hypothetical protein